MLPNLYALKQYFSPFSLLQINTGKAVERKDLVLAKRKILAEFELQNASSILLNEKEVSKNDVLNIFEELEASDDLAYHAIVHADADLLYFLEHNELLDKTVSDTQLLNTVSNNPIITEPFKITTQPMPSRFGLTQELLTEEFINWMSPYFAHSFKNAIFNYYRKKDASAFMALMDNNRYMNSDDEFEAWEPLVNLIELQIQKLDEIADNEYDKNNDTVVGELSSNQQTLLLRAIPTNYFEHQLDNYAVNMMRCSVDIFNKVDRPWAIRILANAKKIAVGDEAMQRVVEKENEMLGIMRGTTTGKQSKDHSSWVMRIGFFVLFFIVKAALFNSNHDDKVFTNLTYNGKSFSSSGELQKAIEAGNYNTEQEKFLGNFITGLIADSIHKTANKAVYKIKPNEDVFNSIWLAQKIKKDAKATDTTSSLKEAPVIVKATDEETALKQEYVAVNNVSELDIIVIVSRRDSVVSSFAKAKSIIKVPLANGTNNVYLYAGKQFSLKDSLQINTTDGETFNIGGLFKQTYPANNKYLKAAITFMISESTSATKITDADITINSNKTFELSLNIKNGTNAKQLQ